MSDYQYDIFISYPHEPNHRAWVFECFLDKFSLYLTQVLGRRPVIYVDEERNTPGVVWPLMLKHALAHSKVLIPIWSVDYFLSDWCRAECAIMYHRQTRLNYGNVTNPKGLILPIRLHDGRFYPPFAKEIAYLDCEDVNLVLDGYKDTKQYFKLLQLIKKWVPEVAKSIQQAPPWNPDWLSVPWLDDPIERWKIDPKFQVVEEPFVVNL